MKTKMLLTLLTMLLLVTNLPIMANTTLPPAGKISGRVIDQQTGAALEYVSVALYHVNNDVPVTGTITAADGSFSIEKVDTGAYEVKLTFIGYTQKTLPKVTVSRQNNRADLGTIPLSNGTTELDEVKVVSEAQQVEYKIDKRVVNVDKNLTSKGGNAVTALENTPSVQVDAQGNLTLRGSSDYVVLIDGKPSVIKGSDALKQIPASAIKQIEVITNPSAKYEADGEAGIINVILKKEKLQGFSGNVNVGIGTLYQNNANALVNYRKNKWNYFTGVDFTKNKYVGEIGLNSKTFMNGDTTLITGNISQFNNNDNLTFRLGTDWDMSDKHSFSLAGSFGRQGYDHGTTSNEQLYTTANDQTVTLAGDNYMDVSGDVVSANFDYKYTINEKSNLLITNQYSSWNGNDNELLKESTSEGEYSGIYLPKIYNTKDNFNYQYRTNVDYTAPLWGGKLETGVQYRYEDRWEDLLYQYKTDPDKDWVRSDTFSYEMNYANTILSGYLIYGGEKNGYGYQLGVRSEYFDRTMTLSNQTDPLDYTKFMFYPSMHFSKTYLEKHQFQLSYSRRIRRPQPWRLNNIPRYLDATNIGMGNINLIPEYTDAIELNFRTKIKDVSLSMQNYYRYTTNPFDEWRYLNDSGIMVHQSINSDYRKVYGSEFGVDFNVFKWWQISTNVNLYHYYNTTEVSDVERESETTTWDGRYINNFQFKKGTRLQTVLYYQAAGADASGQSEQFYVVNLALFQSFFEGKLSASVTGQNILNSIKFDYNTSGAGYDNNYHLSQGGASVIFNVTYNFNNFSNKKRGRNDDIEFSGSGGF